MKKEKTLIDLCYYQTNKKFWDSIEKQSKVLTNKNKTKCITKT